MSDLHKMLNLGKVNEKKLIEANILNQEDLIKLGSKEAFLLIRSSVDAEACLNLLYALEGAIQNIEKKYIDIAIKEDLKEFYKNL